MRRGFWSPRVRGHFIHELRYEEGILITEGEGTLHTWTQIWGGDSDHRGWGNTSYMNSDMRRGFWSPRVRGHFIHELRYEEGILITEGEGTLYTWTQIWGGDSDHRGWGDTLYMNSDMRRGFWSPRVRGHFIHELRYEEGILITEGEGTLYTWTQIWRGDSDSPRVREHFIHELRYEEGILITEGEGTLYTWTQIWGGDSDHRGWGDTLYMNSDMRRGFWSPRVREHFIHELRYEEGILIHRGWGDTLYMNSDMRRGFWSPRVREHFIHELRYEEGILITEGEGTLHTWTQIWGGDSDHRGWGNTSYMNSDMKRGFWFTEGEGTLYTWTQIWGGDSDHRGWGDTLYMNSDMRRGFWSPRVREHFIHELRYEEGILITEGEGTLYTWTQIWGGDSDHRGWGDTLYMNSDMRRGFWSPRVREHFIHELRYEEGILIHRGWGDTLYMNSDMRRGFWSPRVREHFIHELRYEEGILITEGEGTLHTWTQIWGGDSDHRGWGNTSYMNSDMKRGFWFTEGEGTLYTWTQIWGGDSDHRGWGDTLYMNSDMRRGFWFTEGEVRGHNAAQTLQYSTLIVVMYISFFRWCRAA